MPKKMTTSTGPVKRKKRSARRRATVRNQISMRRPMDPQQSLLGQHLNMILDPCQAPLAATAYGGPEGTIQKFVTTGALSLSGSQQAAYLLYVPGGFRSSYGVATTGATPFTITYNTDYVPGYNWLNLNASGARVVGSCVQVHWNQAEQSRGGSLACGVLPASHWEAGVITATIDNLYGLLQKKERIPSGECEIVWNPSEEDATYDRCALGTTVTNFDDKNAVAFAFQGPTGSQLAFTITTIVEYVVKPGNGQPAHSTVHKSVPDAVGQINTALHRLGFKNGPLHDLSKVALKTIARYAPGSGALRLIKDVSGVVHTLLP